MTERLSNNQIAARLRAEKRKTIDPMFFKRQGAIGGAAKVPKGFAKLDSETHKQVSSKGGKANNEKNN